MVHTDTDTDTDTAPAPNEQHQPKTHPAQRLRTSWFFFSVLVVLYFVGQLHLPRVVVLGVFVLYLVAATLWVRAQYVDGLDGCPSVPPARVARITGALAVLALGAGLAARWLGREPPLSSSSLILGGLIALYVLLGYLIARSRAYIDYHGAPAAHVAVGGRPSWKVRFHRWRDSVRSSPRALALILTGLLVVGWGSLWLWGRTPSWSAMAVSAVVVFVPWVLSLLSEHAIRWATGFTGNGLVRVWGAAVVLVLTAAAWIGKETSWVHAAAVLVLAAFVAAIASFTLADIAAVLALLAFGALTPAQDDPDRPFVGEGAPSVDTAQMLVVLGDSYVSGEGAAVFREGTDEGGGNECRRSTSAWPELTGGLRPFTSVVSFACSGADGYNVRHTAGNARSGAAPVAEMKPTPQEQFDGIGTQLDQYDRFLDDIDAPDDFAPELVVLSIGGNDAGFASVGMTCLAPGDCNDEEPEQLWSRGNLDRVQNRIRQVYADVDATFPETPVAVIPYVDPIGSEAPCKQAALSEGDVDFLRTFLPRLNGRVRDTAAEFGFHYVLAMPRALADRNLRLCDPGNNARPGLNFIGIRSIGGLSEQRFNPAKWTHNSLHPNERGHRALHEAFQAWLTDPNRTGRNGADINASGLAVRLERRQGEAPRSEVNSRTAARCETYGFDDSQGCKGQSIAWALRQTGRFAALVAAPAGFLVGIVTWVGAVAFFAGRRVHAASADSAGATGRSGAPVA